MPEERRDYYLTGIDDAAADWAPEGVGYYPPSLDEWNTRRLLAGLLIDTFEEYIAAIKSGKRWNHE